MAIPILYDGIWNFNPFQANVKSDIGKQSQRLIDLQFLFITFISLQQLNGKPN